MPTSRRFLGARHVFMLAIGAMILAVALCWHELHYPWSTGVFLLLALAALVGFLYAVPKLQVASLTGLSEGERFDLENKARTTVAQVLGGAVLLAGLYFTWRTVRVSEDRISAERQSSETNRRIQLFGQLNGERYLITQLHVLKLTADVNVQYESARLMNARAEARSNYLRDLWEQLHLSQQLTIEIAKDDERLYETIGAIAVAFPASDRLRTLMQDLCNYNVKKIGPPGRGMKGKKLEEWRVKESDAAQDFVEQKYGRPMDDLIEYLRHQSF